MKVHRMWKKQCGTDNRTVEMQMARGWLQYSMEMWMLSFIIHQFLHIAVTLPGTMLHVLDSEKSLMKAQATRESNNRKPISFILSASR